jgi:hypothetical protein
MEKQSVHIPPDWGYHCPHGAHVVVLDRIEGGEPVGRMVEPWPCDRCTRDEFEAEMAAEVEESLAAFDDLFRTE